MLELCIPHPAASICQDQVDDSETSGAHAGSEEPSVAQGHYWQTKLSNFHQRSDVPDGVRYHFEISW